MNVNEKGFRKRCPRLGGPVSFVYCRDSAGEGLPCWKIFECWWEHFDVTAYMKAYLSKEDYNRLVQMKPKPKMLSLVELIEQARSNVQQQKSDQE